MKSSVIIIDVQRGYFEVELRPADADAVIGRINSLTASAQQTCFQDSFTDRTENELPVLFKGGNDSIFHTTFIDKLESNTGLIR